MSNEFEDTSAGEYFISFMKYEMGNLGDGACLADYIREFRVDRQGMAVCGGEWDIYLKIVSLIIDLFYRKPEEILPYAGDQNHNIPPSIRTITSVLGKDGVRHPIFDRDEFYVLRYHDPAMNSIP